MNKALPTGVVRSRDMGSHVTLENCHALQFYLEPKGQATTRSIIVWRKGIKRVRPVEPRKHLRDIRPGDEVICLDKKELVVGVEIYR